MAEHAKASKPNYKRKPGGEGLPYSSADKVIGAPPDGNPESGLKPGKGVKGKKTVTPPRTSN